MLRCYSKRKKGGEGVKLIKVGFAKGVSCVCFVLMVGAVLTVGYIVLEFISPMAASIDDGGWVASIMRSWLLQRIG